ncbi:MAG: flagellar hook-length control protein FliK [Boseongicola sp.]
MFGQESLGSTEQTLTADGSDRLFRNPREPVLDALRRLDAGVSRIDLARSVSAQIGDAARASVDGRIEVRLSPEELGRVSLSMKQTELGLTVSIVAERAETIDLIRRNSDLFAQNLRNLGHQNIAFSFDQGTGRQSFDDKSNDADHNAEKLATDPGSTQKDERAFRVAENGRLDIRL